MRSLALLALLALLASIGCAQERTDFPTCDAGTEPAALDHTPTWSEDAGPLVMAHCSGCHQEGGSAPFSLTTHDDAVAWAQALRTAVVHRTMPPPGPTGCGDCRTFRDSRWLTPEAVATLRDWVDGGTLPGPDLDLPEPAAAVVPLDRVDRTLTLPEPYTPTGDGADDYRCFLVDPDLDADAFLTGFAVTPGTPGLVHHVILYATYTEDQLQLARTLEEEDGIPGFSCFGDSGIDDAPMLAVWAPGGQPARFPEGTGIRIRAERPLILQVHYNLAEGVVADQSSIDLRLDASVGEEAFIADMTHDEFVLAPGEAEVVSEHEHEHIIGPVGRIQVHGIAPHMHKAGRSLQVETWNASGTTCLVDVPRYDFNWQNLYFYEEPVEVRGNDRISIRCTWDTTGREGEIRWGDSTEDEMCLALFYITGIDPALVWGE